jgi:hypothetical protein
MLAGDEGASNTDPYAEGPTADNEWIVEGAHLMMLAPAEFLAAFPTDPHNSGLLTEFVELPTVIHLKEPECGSRRTVR